MEILSEETLSEETQSEEAQLSLLFTYGPLTKKRSHHSLSLSSVA